MPERIEKILRFVCLLLAALVVYQVSRLVLRRDSLAHLNIPALPVLAGDTNAPAKAKDTKTENPKAEALTTQPAVASGTNATNLLARQDVTNKTAIAKSQGETNATTMATVQEGTDKTTNSSVMPEIPGNITNLEAHSLSKPAAGLPEAQETNSTNLALNSKPGKTGTKTVTLQTAETPEATGATTNGTNLATVGTAKKTDTNSSSAQLSTTNGTNVVLGQGSANKATNTGLPQGAKKGPNAAQHMGPGKTQAPELPPAIQARVDKIIQSEILGQIMRPMPMALLGIAGKDVFLRAPNGQTGLVKEGDELGGVKIVRIGINRVLVEEDGQKQELTLFAGLGSESLLSNTNSPTK